MAIFREYRIATLKDFPEYIFMDPPFKVELEGKTSQKMKALRQWKIFCKIELPSSKISLKLFLWILLFKSN